MLFLDILVLGPGVRYKQKALLGTSKLLLSAGLHSQAECAGGQTGGLYMTDLVLVGRRGGSVGWKDVVT